MSIHAVATTTESMTTRKSKGDEKDGMGSKPLGGFTAAICMIKDGEKEKKEARRERAGNGGGGQWPGLTFMRASSTETNGPHKTCHVLPLLLAASCVPVEQQRRSRLLLFTFFYHPIKLITTAF